MRDPRVRRLGLLSFALLAFRVASAVVVSQPGYTDAYYYADVASRLARGLGLTADFVWAPLEVGPLPIESHRFWMPMASVVQAVGIAPLGGVLGDFRAGQLMVILVAALVPAVTYVAARGLGASDGGALIAATIAGLGGLFAPAWVSTDGFAPAALLGTLFFIAYAHAARGSTAAAVLAGALTGLLYLTRAEAALFGLALLWLSSRPQSRRAGVFASAVALAIGLGWLARDVVSGVPSGLFARTALLVRYEDFFALRDPSLDGFVVALPEVMAVKANALATNAVTFVFSFALLLVVPLAVGVRALWAGRAEVRAWASLVLLVFAVQSLVWTLHSTRGSYFHSLGAFFPFGIAVAVVGGERILARRPTTMRAWSGAAVVLVAVISLGSLAQWDASFNGGTRPRAAALEAIPAGSFLAIDAAAWRWLSGRPVLVTPADGIEVAACFVNVPEPHATSLVLEEAHFRAYDELYRGGPRPEWLGSPIERGPIKIFPIISATPCHMAFSR